jgi:hypothetical protein
MDAEIYIGTVLSLLKWERMARFQLAQDKGSNEVFVP